MLRNYEFRILTNYEPLLFNVRNYLDEKISESILFD